MAVQRRLASGIIHEPISVPGLDGFNTGSHLLSVDVWDVANVGDPGQCGAIPDLPHWS